MLKFAIVLVLIVASMGQEDPNEVCLGVEDNTLIGLGQEISCSAYYACEGEYGYEEDCAELYGNEFQFNYETNACDYDDVVQCGFENPVDPEPVDPEPNPPEPNPPATQPPTTTDPSGIPDIECPTNRPGEILFFPSSNCSEYFVCASGVRVKLTCMEGFTWNADENQCDYPIYSRCSSNISDDGLNVRCTRTGFYSTAYPRDCTKFVFCSAGIPMVQNCPVGYAWNIDRCVERKYASCPDLRLRNI